MSHDIQCHTPPKHQNINFYFLKFITINSTDVIEGDHIILETGL